LCAKNDQGWSPAFRQIVAQEAGLQPITSDKTGSPGCRWQRG
jgi:hypothetical protein